MQLEKTYPKHNQWTCIYFHLDLKINFKKPDWNNTKNEPLISFIYLRNNKTYHNINYPNQRS
jgi:hypothetical protein